MVKFFDFVFLLLGVFCLSFGLAAVLVSDDTTTFSSINESLVAQYNFSVNNTQATENVTEVNITLPNGFVFIIDSNDTDLGFTTFTNVSSILTWNGANITNGSLNYFWFNATSSSTSGDYNFTITVSNSTGVFEVQNLSVVVNDTTGPIINLSAPADSATSTTNAYYFTFVVLDDNNVSNCSLVFDGVAINVLSIVNNTGGENSMYNSSLSVGSHTWNVNCTDSLGNIGSSSSRILVVSEEEVAEETSSSGSGGFPTYRPSEDKLSSGYEVFLGSGYKVNFDISGESHLFEVDSISSDKVKIIVSSTPVVLELDVGDTEKFDLDGDGFYDLSVYLKSVSGGRANFVLTSVSEQISSSDNKITNEEILEAVPGGNTEVNIEGSYRDSETSWMIWIILVIVLIFVVILFFWKKSDKKSKKKNKK